MGINTVIAEARALIQDKIDRERERGRNRTLKIMMVGIPNVGKSSLINRLIGKASTKTGDKPGVTRGKQWLRIKGDAELLDTPRYSSAEIRGPNSCRKTCLHRRYKRRNNEH